MPRPYVLAETNYATTQDVDFRVAVLPWGAVEAHNLHLPYATDVLQCDWVAAESARIAWERGAKVVVLPTVPYGVNTGQLEVKLDINMNPGTQLAVLRDVAQCLETQGIGKLLVLNGHGGNDFRQMIRELHVQFPKLFMCCLEWWRVVDAREYFPVPGDHGGRMETSCMMHIVPELLLPLSQAGDGAARQFKPAALREGWAWAQRDWPQVTQDTGVGNPAGATPESGEKFLRALTEKIAGFLVELAACDNEEMYEG